MVSLTLSPHRFWALLGLAAVAGFAILIGRFWHPVFGFTGLFQFDGASEANCIREFKELPVYVHRDNGGYDGLYYAQIAQDPSLSHPELARATDNLPYRARRILPPAVAWLAGFGQPLGILHAYSVLNIVAWLALAWMTWSVFRVESVRGYIAWFGLLFSAGALASVRLSLTDLVALSFVCAAMLAFEKGALKGSLWWLVLGGLSRETTVLAVAGILRRPWFSLRNLALGLGVILPLAGWLVYVRWRVGPADAGWSNLTLPVAGLVEKWRVSLSDTVHLPDRLLAIATFCSVIGLTVQAAYFVVRWRVADAWWRLGAAYAGLLLCLGTAVWEGHPGAATRVLLPLNLAFNVLALRGKASYVWLIAGNLTVVSGLLAVRDVPIGGELAALGRPGGGVTVRVDAGWYGIESKGSRRWSWAGQSGRLVVRSWPASNGKVRVAFSTRALSERTVSVSSNGDALASFPVGLKLFRQEVVVSLVNGISVLEFTSSAPPEKESLAAGSRALGFALYDVELTWQGDQRASQ